MAREGSDKYSEALLKAGVDMKALADGTLTTDEAMMQAVEGLSLIANEQDRAAAATELFGVKLARELMPALEGGVEGLEATRQKARDLGIVMSDEAAVKAEEFNDSMEDLQAGVKGAFMEFATNLIPVLTDQLLPALQEHLIPAVQTFAEKIQALIEWFMDLSPTMQKAILIIIAIVSAVGPLLFVFGKAISLIGGMVLMFSKLIPIMSTVGAVIGGLSAPVLIAIAAIAALIAIGVLLWKNWDTVKAKVVEVWGRVVSFLKGIDLKQIGMDIIRGLISGVASMASAVVDSVKGVVGGAITGAKKLLGIASPSKVFKEIGEFTGEGLEEGMRSMGKRVSNAGERMAESSIPDITRGSVTNNAADLSPLIQAINALAGRDVVLAINDREFARATGGAMSQEIGALTKGAGRRGGLVTL